MGSDSEPLPEIAHFRVLRRLGAGAMGVVYLGHDADLDRKVAIKVLAEERLTDRERLRMQREAQALARLSHPNVVQVYEVGRDDASLFVAMEFVDGVDLATWGNDEPRSWQETVGVYVQAARGLHAAHEAGLVHRDFKPANVMLGVDGRVRVLDFGLARPHALGEDDLASEDGRSSNPSTFDQRVTRTGATVGTPAYMAPEQFTGEEVDARSDQFSFCVALYEALYGRRPFAGRTRFQLVAAVSRGQIEPTPAGSKVPARVRKAVLRGLSVDPSDRHASLEALAEVLTRPSTSRRVVGVGLVVVATAGSAVMLTDRETPDPCRTGADDIDADWNDDAKAGLAEAFGRIDGSYAGEALERTTTAIDEYAEAWRSGRHDACAATLIEGAQSGELMDQRIRCLRGRRTRLAAMVELLADADDELVRRSVDAVRELPPVSDCANPEYVRAPVPRPADPASAEELERLEDELAKFDAHVLAWRFPSAREIIDPILPAARDLGYEPMISATLEGLAHLEMVEGKHEESEAHYIEAFMLALSTDDPLVAFASALGVARNSGRGGGSEGEDPHRWLDLATALVPRTGEGPMGVARVRKVRGSLYHEEGKLEEALVELSAAIDLEQVNPVWEAEVHKMIAKVHELRDEFAEARQAYQKAYRLSIEARGENHPSIGHFEASLGQLASFEGRHADAIEHYERAEALLGPVLATNNPTRVSIRHNRADALLQLGRYEEALVAQREALDGFLAIVGEQHPAVASAYNNLGNLLRRTGDRTAALEALHKSLEIRRAVLPEGHPAIANSLDSIASVLENDERYEEALEYRREAKALTVAKLGAEHTTVAGQLNNIGGTLRRLGRLDEAESTLLEAARMWAAVTETTHPDAADVEHNLAAVYRDQGRLEQALERAEAACRIRRDTVGEQHPALADSLELKAGILEAQGESAAAQQARSQAAAIREN